MGAGKLKVGENVTTKTSQELEELAKQLLSRGYNLYTLTAEFAEKFKCNASVTYEREYIVLSLQAIKA